MEQKVFPKVGERIAKHIGEPQARKYSMIAACHYMRLN